MRTARLRRTGAGLLGSTVALAALVGCSHENDKDEAEDPAAATSEESEADEPDEAAVAAADWVAGQLTDGVLFNDEYDAADYSTTVEAAYALLAVDPEHPALEEIAPALEDGVDAYASPGKDVYAGSTAKLVSYAVDSGADPTDFGGDDLVAQMEERTDETGRISDQSEFGDYANSLGQAWAVRALTSVESAEADAAWSYLLDQQCGDGYLRQDFPKAGGKETTCDDDGSEPSVDATALAVVLLHDVAADDPDKEAALADAVAWLTSQQSEDGSFEGGGTIGANANSTGLAGWAFHVAGEEEAAERAATWVRAHQVEGCDGALAEESGAIGYDDATVEAAGADGITEKTAYPWRLATVQAAPALLATPDDAEPAACPAG